MESPRPPTTYRKKKVVDQSTSTSSFFWSADQFFSPNPDKAWAEQFFLKYSLVWPVLFGLWASSGLHLRVGDGGNLIATCVIAAPNVVIPYWYCPSKHLPVYDTFWFKYLLWIFIYAFVATYFWTEYFFDVLGMKYEFPHLSWNFDSILVGSGKQRVPLMMLVRIF